MFKKILFLSSGGIWGAVQPMMMKKIRDKSWYHIYGCSIGAINGGFLAQFKKKDMDYGVEKLEKLWKTDLGLQQNPTISFMALKNHSLHSNAELKHAITDNIKIPDHHNEYPVFHCPVSNMHSGKIEIVSNSRQFNYRPEMNRYVLASASMPILFPFIEIDNNYYSDGGIMKYFSRFDFTKLESNYNLEIDILHTTPKNWNLHIEMSEYNKSIGHNVSNLIKILIHNIKYNDLDRMIENLRDSDRKVIINNYYIKDTDEYRELVESDIFAYNIEIIKKISLLEIEKEVIEIA